jgi:hypothetical protein
MSTAAVPAQKPALHDPRWVSTLDRKPTVADAPIWIDDSKCEYPQKSPQGPFFHGAQSVGDCERGVGRWITGTRWLSAVVAETPISFKDHKPTTGDVWCYLRVTGCWYFFHLSFPNTPWHSDWSHWLPGSESQKPTVVPDTYDYDAEREKAQRANDLGLPHISSVERDANWERVTSGRIKRGDWLDNLDDYRAWAQGYIGYGIDQVLGDILVYRRKAVAPAPVVSVQFPGYRLLGDDEVIQQGDKFSAGTWQNNSCQDSVGMTVREAVKRYKDIEFHSVRRPIVQPAKAPRVPTGTPPAGYRWLCEHEIVQLGDLIVRTSCRGYRDEVDAPKGGPGDNAWAGHRVGDHHGDFEASPFARKIGTEVFCGSDSVTPSKDSREQEIERLKATNSALQGKCDRQTNELRRLSAELAFSREARTAAEKKATHLEQCNERQASVFFSLHKLLGTEAGSTNKLVEAVAELKEAHSAQVKTIGNYQDRIRQLTQRDIQDVTFRYVQGIHGDEVIVTKSGSDPLTCVPVNFLFVPKQELNNANATISQLRRELDDVKATNLNVSRDLSIKAAELAAARVQRDASKEQFETLQAVRRELAPCVTFVPTPTVELANQAARLVRYQKQTLATQAARIEKFESHQAKWHRLWEAAGQAVKVMGKTRESVSPGSYLAYHYLKSARDLCTAEVESVATAQPGGIYTLGSATTGRAA